MLYSHFYRAAHNIFIIVDTLLRFDPNFFHFISILEASLSLTDKITLAMKAQLVKLPKVKVHVNAQCFLECNYRYLPTSRLPFVLVPFMVKQQILYFTRLKTLVFLQTFYGNFINRRISLFTDIHLKTTNV